MSKNNFSDLGLFVQINKETREAGILKEDNRITAFIHVFNIIF